LNPDLLLILINRTCQTAQAFLVGLINYFFKRYSRIRGVGWVF
jgi:hypothetical protein